MENIYMDSVDNICIHNVYLLSLSIILLYHIIHHLPSTSISELIHICQRLETSSASSVLGVSQILKYLEREQQQIVFLCRNVQFL